MNEIEIISANDQTLPAIAGKVLQKPYYVGTANIVCGNCGKKSAITMKKHRQWTVKCQWVNCKAPQIMDKSYFYRTGKPIPLTWLEARKWQDWAVEKYGKHAFFKAVEKVFNARGIALTGLNVLYETKAQDYIKAACLCTEKGV